MILTCITLAVFSLLSTASAAVLPRSHAPRGYVNLKPLPQLLQTRDDVEDHGRRGKEYDIPILIIQNSAEKSKSFQSKNEYRNDLNDAVLGKLKELIGLTYIDGQKRNPTKKMFTKIGFHDSHPQRKHRLYNSFDSNGMLFLTKPTGEAEDRKLNYLLAKIVDQKLMKNKSLRNTLSEFNSKEIEKLKQISRAIVIDEDDDSDNDNSNILRDTEDAAPHRTEFEFAELVI